MKVDQTRLEGGAVHADHSHEAPDRVLHPGLVRDAKRLAEKEVDDRRADDEASGGSHCVTSAWVLS
jgi:hypothetical protein